MRIAPRIGYWVSVLRIPLTLAWAPVPQVRYVGVSNETSYGVSEFARAAAAAGLPRVQTIQNAYSLLVRVPFETDLAETCRCGRRCSCSMNAWWLVPPHFST